jgi:hypothetical protein
MKYALFIVSLCAISGAAIVGCSAASAPYTQPDTGSNKDNGDAGTPTEDVKPGAAFNGLTPNVYLVNAATGLGDIRLCFLPDANPAIPSDTNIPQTNYPGLAAGGALFFKQSSDVRGMTVTPFAVSASGLGEAEFGRKPYSCNELSTNPIIKRIPIRSITFHPPGLASIYALVGCPVGVGDVTRCGSDFDSINGNLQFIEVSVTSVVPDMGIGALALNLSPSMEANVKGKSADTRIGPVAVPCSGASIGQGFDLGVIQPAATMVARPSAFDADGFAVCVQQQSVLVRSYAAIQQATDPTALPGDWFHDKADYVFAIVGDTTVQSGPESVHALAIPFEAAK